MHCSPAIARQDISKHALLGQVADIVERFASSAEGVERAVCFRPGVESGNGEAQRRVIGHELVRIYDRLRARDFAISFHTRDT